MNGEGGLALLRLRRAVALLLLPWVSACMMWHPANLSELAPEAVPDRVRVTREDGSSIVLDYAALRADSITGVAGGTSTTVAVTDVRTLESWGLDPGFIFVPAVVAFLLLLNHFPLNDGPSTGVVN